MGMREAFKKAAQVAFIAVGNVKETVIYRSKTSASTSYDPDTGVTTDSYTDYSVAMIINKSQATQIDNRVILENDYDAMIPVDNLTSTPKLHDQIIRNTTDICDIVWFHVDAAAALWTFQIRKL
jgi:hypothetical protein